MYITFKGVTSTSMNVVVESMNWFQRPQKRAYIDPIKGKDGTTVTEDSYGPLTIKAVIGLKSTASIDDVIAWLDGSGALVCSDDPLKYRTATVLEDIDYQKLVRYKKATVVFYCADPYRYVASEATVTKTTFPATYTNAGTMVAKPLLKVTGTGTVSVTIGANTMSVILDTAYVYIDSLSMDVYHLTTLKNRNSTGTFPTLAVGSNTIGVTGTVTEIVITPRTRYL